jgi:hypothetical protein
MLAKPETSIKERGFERLFLRAALGRHGFIRQTSINRWKEVPE